GARGGAGGRRVALGGPPRRPGPAAGAPRSGGRGRRALPGRYPAPRPGGALPLAHRPLGAGARRIGPGAPPVRHGDRDRRPQAGRGGAAGRRAAIPIPGRGDPPPGLAPPPSRPGGVGDSTSPRLLEYLGLAPGDPMRPAWVAALHPEDRARTVEAWERSVREGTEYRGEYRLRGADGEYRWFLGHALPQRDDA